MAIGLKNEGMGWIVCVPWRDPHGTPRGCWDGLAQVVAGILEPQGEPFDQAFERGIGQSYASFVEAFDKKDPGY